MSLYRLQRAGDAEALVDHLRDSESDAVRSRAAELLGDLDDADPAVVDALVAAATEDDDPRVRGAAIDALDSAGQQAVESLFVEWYDDFDGEGADWVVADAFVEALSAERPELRMAAANALGRLDERRAVPPLLDLLSDPDHRVRARVARACGTLADARAVDPLASLLADDSVEVRREAASALAAIGDDRAFRVLTDHADDSSATVRRVAVAALGDSGRLEAVDVLVDALDDESDGVRRAAAFSLVELLSAAEGDRSHAVRERVVERLGTAPAGIVDPLVDVVERGSQTTRRRNAVWLLGHVAGGDDRRTIDALVEVIGDEDPTTARFAATSLADIGGERVETALLSVLDEDDATERARANAAFVLGRVGGNRARERLDALVGEEPSEQVRKQAFSALSKLGGHG